MDNLREKAIEISNKFPFSEFQTSAAAVSTTENAEGKVSSCENHLDVKFMNLLEQGAHLDFIARVWQ